MEEEAERRAERVETVQRAVDVAERKVRREAEEKINECRRQLIACQVWGGEMKCGSSKFVALFKSFDGF